MNLFFRAVHVASKGNDLETNVAYGLHVMFQSMAAAWRNQNVNHLLIALDGRSWRKDFYAPYKADRAVKRAAATEAEQKESEAFFKAFYEMVEFLEHKTNVTILQHNKLEADDLIAGWIQAHPDDEHVIGSSDTDYYQLLAPNVTQYNGVTQELHTLAGIFDYKGKQVIDKKTKLPKAIPDPKFILFEKCTRGDPTDNIFSAYPGVRVKGSKNKVGITEAFADRNSKGYNYNNFMLQRWQSHDGTEHKVLDDFRRNEILIDLSAQPPDIRAMIDETIKAASVAKQVSMIGAHFLKFCGRYDLIKLSENANTYATILSSSYN